MNKAIAIVGPTAIGKTKISIELAKRFNLEIISGDSVAVYKRLDIGSAKPTITEMDGVKHYLIDDMDPSEQYNVELFQKKAREILDRNKATIICGGTGLYIKSAIYNYEFDAPKRDESFKDRFEHASNEELYKYLLELDPELDRDRIHPNNRKRVLRAIEIKESTNKSISSMNDKNNPLYDAYIIYLNIENRDILYDRINKRVDKMMEEGLLDEVKALYDEGILPYAIGYKEFIPYFEGVESLESVVDEVKKNSRHLAKHQMTWFRHQMSSHFYEVNLDDINETIEKIASDIEVFLNE